MGIRQCLGALYCAKERKILFYFCAKDKSGSSCIGVAVAEHPAGPFQAQHQPLLTMEMMKKYGISMGQTIDPSIYQEDGIPGFCLGTEIRLL